MGEGLRRRSRGGLRRRSAGPAGLFGAAHGERRARGGGGREEAKRPEAVGQEGRRAARWPSRAARAHLGVDHADLEGVLERQLAETSPDARGHAREGYGQV